MMRLSLKELFAGVAFCAIVAWCGLQVRFDNQMFWLALVGSVGLAALFVFLAKDKRSQRYAPLAGAPCLLCCLSPVFSLALLINAALLLLVGCFVAFLPLQPVRKLAGVAAVCTTISLVAAVIFGWGEVRRLEETRKEFPLIPLATRLDYEPSKSSSAPRISGPVESRLVKFEQELDVGNYREFQLKRLHDQQHEKFVRAIGFGVARMLRPIPESMRLEPLRDVDANERIKDEPKYRRDWRAFARLGKSFEIELFHTASRNDFLDANAFGAVDSSKREVVGFVEHGFHYAPVDAMEDRKKWRIERLELVSLRRFDEPRAYVLDHLPRMDQLSADNAPTRPLDEFESEALPKLRTEDDLIISRAPPEYRMLGSLRAAKRCADCHSVNRGELLGAFSYVLRDLKHEQ